MAPLRLLFSVIYTYIFKFKLSKWIFWQVKAVQCEHYYCHQIGSQVFAIEPHHCESCWSWPWPTFSRSRISTVEYLGNGESYRKCTTTTSIEVNIWYRMGPLWMLCYSTMTYILKITNLKRYYLGNDESYCKMRHMTFAEVDNRHRMTPSWMLYSVPLIFMFKVKHVLVMHLLSTSFTGSGFCRFVFNRMVVVVGLLLLRKR